MKRLFSLILLAVSAFSQTSNYPAALDNDASLFVTADNVQSTLSVAATAGDATITVSSGTGFAANQIATICDNVTATGKCTAFEHMKVTAVNGNVLNVTRGFAGTSARSHTAGRLVSVLIDAAHQQALKDAIIKTQTALGSNLSNVSQARVSTLYNFTAQTPGVDLAPGNNAITLTPVPAGVNGSDSNHYLYISNGTGTAEACLITGGAAVAGAASGQLIINCAGAHTGSWTIQSATAGIQEAIQSLDAKGGAVYVPAGDHSIYATIHIGNGSIAAQSTRNGQLIEGAGTGINGNVGTPTAATRLDWYGANGGKIMQVNGPVTGVRIRNLAFNAQGAGNIAANALYSIHAYMFRWENLYAEKTSGYAFSLKAYENPAGFAAGSGDGVVDGLFTENLQTTGSGLDVGSDTYGTSPYLNVARVAYRNLSLLVGSGGVGMRLCFTDSSVFDQVFTLGGATGLLVENPGGSANNFPTAITMKNTYFGGTAAVSTPVGWHPTQASDIYGGLLFAPWGAEVGAPPNVNGVYGFTDNNQYFNFKLFPRPLTLVNGANNDVAVGNAGMVRVTGPSGAYSITGFAGGRDGRVLVLVGNTGGVLTIKNQDAGSAAGNRISVPGGADVALSNGTQSAMFVYSNSDSCWYFVAGK